MTAVVLAAYGQQCLVRVGNEDMQLPVRKRAGKPVCGDRVLLEDAPQGKVVGEIEERVTEFARADRRGRRQVIAANVDQVVVVIAPAPAPTRDIVNRYIAAAELIGARPALCQNKVDRPPSADGDACEARLDVIDDVGYPVFRVSAKSGQGMDAFAEYLRGKTSILVGQSGVGKTSLANSLLNTDLETSRLSHSTGKGRHTTSAATLYELPQGGFLMDSPGVWEYGLWAMEPSELTRGFVEFAEFSAQCRFANCTHIHEPGCAVIEAAECGAIRKTRLESYQRIAQSLPKAMGY